MWKQEMWMVGLRKQAQARLLIMLMDNCENSSVTTMVVCGYYD